MLNIINSFQNKGYPKTLFHNSYSTNNIKINTKTEKEFENKSNNDYPNTNKIYDKMINSKNNELIIAEKTQNIQLNITIKKVDIETKQVPLEIIIHNYYDNKNIISIQIIDNNDPLFFYCLNIDEIEYQQLKKEQSLFIEFKNFSDFIFKMLNNCLKENFNCFITIMKNEEVYIKIEEQTQFRRLNHLTLKLNPLNNSNLKIHLGKILNEHKEKYDKLLEKNKEITRNIDILKNEKHSLETNYEKLKNENKEEIEKIINEKNKDINNLNEKNLKQKEIIEKYSNENNILKEEINKIKINLDDLNNNNSKLNDENLNLQKSYKELEKNYNNIQLELEEKTKNILELKGINDELNEEIYNYKKQNEELENKNKDLESEKEKCEDINKSLKLINIKFENKLKMSIKEINKANDIIEKFQNEIKSQKAKIKSLKNEINSKTKIINEKQNIIDNLENNINELDRNKEEKKEDIILLKKDFGTQEMKIKEEDIKYSSNLNINNNYEIEENQNYKNDNRTEKEVNNFNQSNSDYNPSYFFTFYKKIQNNSSAISNNKKNNIENFLKPENEKSIRNQIKHFEEIKTNENSYDTSGVYNNIYSYQFREIKGSYFNECKKKREYFSNFPLSLNQSERINILDENK